MSLDFMLLDVFTPKPFGGNQLAVFPDGSDIDARTMQAIAREFNFSETVFALPPRGEGEDYGLRIFTPNTELPFAGHPTCGAAAALTVHGDVATEHGAGTILFQTGAGPVRVDVALESGLVYAHLVRGNPVELPSEKPPAGAAMQSLGLEGAPLDLFYASVGLRFAYVELASAEEVDAARLDLASWETHFKHAWSPNLFFYARTGEDRVHARMFAPAFGIAEDPATGSACAAFAGALAARSERSDGAFKWDIAQGVKMGRPSAIVATAEKSGGTVVTTGVGGHSVVVGSGRLSL